MNVQQGTTEEKRAHAKKRAEQRHGLTLNRYDLNEMRNHIVRSKAFCVERQSIDRAKFYIVFRGKEMVVVYSRRHKTIVTLLPPGCPEEKIGRRMAEERKRLSEEKANKQKGESNANHQ
jgi:hypothetical protein